ncbi:SDR family NAD(P)-dependent oxidoreductase [Klebsiella pneumoniae]|uniref:SDR family NAD(P)-dependent oxidoreductase n=1 Tax=Klebsiella pneumoniae TaxID=573 RepID=A0A923EMC0_KLEPN|nr:SDR family NAD(P)-dependent oxidoreductase [Klebsiella pneumoniae]
MKSDQHNTILIVGASRGLGHAMAATFLQHGWRSSAPCAIYHPTRRSTTAKTHPLRLRPATLDIRDEAQLTALQATLPAASLDILFVNAGTTNRDPSQTIGDVHRGVLPVMLTNAPRRCGLSSACSRPLNRRGCSASFPLAGSLTNNLTGQRELYRGSKAALNMFMRSFAARPPRPPIRWW